jgi:hypothetical protein
VKDAIAASRSFLNVGRISCCYVAEGIYVMCDIVLLCETAQFLVSI